MAVADRSNGDGVIDLTDARDRVRRDAGSHTSGLHRSSAGHAPPWRGGRRSSILERPQLGPSNEPLPAPAELRRSLFDSDERVLTPKPLEFVRSKADRSLGNPYGTRLQRLFKRS